MPVRKVKGGYKYGSQGKTYKNKADAERQGRAIQANRGKGPSNKRKKKTKR
jgi:hypothetical protein